MPLEFLFIMGLLIALLLVAFTVGKKALKYQKDIFEKEAESDLRMFKIVQEGQISQNSDGAALTIKDPNDATFLNETLDSRYIKKWEGHATVVLNMETIIPDLVTMKSTIKRLAQTQH